jgi:hypothetical protein
MRGINEDIISKSDNAFTSGARVLLGLFFLASGVAMFFVPGFRASLVGQLAVAGIPLQRLTLFVIPLLLGASGVMLMQGVLIRLASLIGILLMALLTYMHLVVDSPTVFPQQFGFPFIPVVALVLSAFLYFVDSYGGE